MYCRVSGSGHPLGCLLRQSESLSSLTTINNRVPSAATFFFSSLHLLPASHWRLGSGPVTKDGLCLCTSACCQRPSCLSLSVTSAERGPPFLPRLPAGTGRPCLFLFRALRPKRRSRSAARDSNAAAPTRETEQHAPACATRFSKVRPPSGNEATHTSRSGSPNFAGTCRFPSQTSAVLSRSHAAC